MTTTKETRAGAAAAEKGGSPTGVGVAAKLDPKATKVEVCHPSVCVGDVKPTNCVCPSEKK